MGQFLRSLRLKLLIVLLIAAVLPVSFTAALNIAGTLNLLEHEVDERQLETTQIAASQIHDFVNNITAELTLLGEAASALELRDEMLGRYLLSYETSTSVENTSYGVYRSLWLMDAEGNELARVDDGQIIISDTVVNRREEEIFFRPERGEHYFSAVRLIGGVPQISVAFPIYQDGEFVGVSAGVIDLQQPWQNIENLRFGDEGYAMLVDQRGNLIVHYDEAVLNQRWNLATLPPVASALQHSDQLQVYRYQSPIAGEVLGSAAVIEGPDWVLIAERPTAEAFQAEAQARQNGLVAVGISLILAVGMGWLFSRQITRPVTALQKVTQNISAGNLNERVQVKSSDEIGQLGVSFNAMAEQLSSLLNTLEERIEQRTRDLQVAADVARQVAQTLDLNQLLADVVKLTRASFDLYHVSIYVYNSETDDLFLRAATGDQGQLMLAKERQFKMHEAVIGAVPKAGRTHSHALISDVRQSSEYYAHALLPDALSQLALPMLIATPNGEQLIGILDLLSDQADHFSSDDVKVMTTLASQTAVAIRNVDLYSQAEKAREAAEKANSVKSQFLATVSHELRTPLNAILNFTQFVTTGTAGPVTDEQLEFLEYVVSSGKHLLNLINDVLDISSIESGSLKLYVEDNVNLSEEVKTVAGAAGALLEDKPVTLLLNLPAECPSVIGDRRRLRQVMLNLISNACKFTDQGTITIELKQEAQQILFAVHDTGPGIATEDHELIFETFRQTDVGVRKGGGTGLGLPISRRLVELHGGRLWLESCPGKGSSFFASIPVMAEQLVPYIRAKKGN